MRRWAFVLLATLAGSWVGSVHATPAEHLIVVTESSPKWMVGWTRVSDEQRASIADDDIQRHAGDPAFWNNIAIDERRFSENGFDWHLLRFSSTERLHSVVWVVPHDDENAAFEAMIAAIKKHGGMGLVVNSGPGSLRRQSGYGRCGVRPNVTRSCDPNRNFAASSPLFTAAFLDHRTEPGQPVIALHTNGAGAVGDFSLLDIEAFKRGKEQLRDGGYRARNPQASMDNYDTLGLVAYRAVDGMTPDAVRCRNALNDAGIHFWHERFTKSDGSLSNYLALQHPDIAYFNAESREETDLSVAAARHMIMIDAYLGKCVGSGD